jgi:dTDP-glucose 4,6-dehydratase
MTLLSTDIDFLVRSAGPLADDLRGKRILITGGTGVFGSWLLEALVAANEHYALDLSVTILTRSPERFNRLRPHLANDAAVTLVQGDVRTWDIGSLHFDYIIHAAAESHKLSGTRLDMVETITDGTRRLLAAAVKASCASFLFVSSNAVYGRAPTAYDFIPESCTSGPRVTDDTVDYDESKRMAEALCMLYFREHGLSTKIARCFPVVGPYLPLDAHFAIGNFIGNALKGEPIVVKGDGTPERSYLYLADLAVWLLTILAKGEAGEVYNVGSEEAVNVAELASQVSTCVEPTVPVRVLGSAVSGTGVSRFVPSTELAQRKLGLTASYSLEQALKSTIAYHNSNPAVTSEDSKI